MLAIDHAFICCSRGAPEARALLELGLIEGSGNRHPGQGTANRRFFFANAYLELLWVSDEDEARGPETKDTRLWQRWSQRHDASCPFGILLRSDESPLPFETWSYKPDYLPAGTSIEFARGVPVTEPELAVIASAGPVAPLKEPIEHRVPIRRVSKIDVFVPTTEPLSKPAAALHERGVVTFNAGGGYLLEFGFTSGQPLRFDLRPVLPLVFRSFP
jgi:glyoxalase-like protein